MAGQQSPANCFQEVFFYLNESGNEHTRFISRALRLPKDTDQSRLQKAVDLLIQRHDALRTMLLWDKSSKGVVQRVIDLDDARVQSSLSFENLRPRRDREGLVNEKTINKMDLGTTLPCRIELTSVDDGNEPVLVIDMLPTIYDDVSWETIKNDLTNLYRLQADEVAGTQLEPAASFVSFANSQRQLVDGERGQQARAYFSALLDHHAPLELPNDPPNLSVSQGRNLSQFTITADDLTKIDTCAKLFRITASTVLASAYVLTLSAYADRNEVVLGHHFTNRLSAESAQCVGRHENILPVKVSVDAESSTERWLQTVHGAIDETERYQDYPFEVLARDIGVDYAGRTHPVFLHTYRYREASMAETNSINHDPDVAHWAVEELQLPAVSGTGSAVELEMVVERRKGYATVTLTSPRVKLTKKSIATFRETYKLVLSQLVDLEGRSSPQVKDLLWTRRKIMQQPRSLTTPKPIQSRSLAALFEDHAAREPQAIAVVCGDSKLTFEELQARSNQLANYLLEVGVQRGRYFAIVLDPCVEMMVTVLASWKLGAPYIPIYPSETPQERLASIFEDAQIRHGVTVEKYVQYVETQVGVAATAIDTKDVQSAIARQDTSYDSSDINGDDIAYCSFTSGTTGRPKGVITPHKGVVLFAEDFRSVYFDHPAEAGVEQSVLMLSRLVTDFSVEQIVLGFCSGNKLVMVPPEIRDDNERMHTYLNDNRVTYISGPALAIGRFDLSRLPHVRIMVTCGEKFQRSMLDRMRRSFRGSIYNGYGITETAIYTTIRRNEVGDAWTPSVGWPGVGQRFYITDANSRLLPYGAVGELYISGVGVARGYLNRPEKTRQTFLSNPFVDPSQELDHAVLYRTGDYMRFMDDGSLEFRGRTDNKVIVRGIRIDPDEVKACLALFPDIKECEVLSKSQLGDLPGRSDGFVAYYSSLTGKPFSTEAIAEFLAKRVPHDVIPDEFLYVDGDFPSTSSGKLEVRRLPQASGGELMRMCRRGMMLKLSCVAFGLRL